MQLKWHISPFKEVRWFELLLLYGRGMSTWEYAIIQGGRREYGPDSWKLEKPTTSDPECTTYKILYQTKIFIQLLNIAGADGWELCGTGDSVHQAHRGYAVIIMRREIGQGSSSDFIKS